MTETSPDTRMQMQTATEDGDQDPYSEERRIQRERLTIWNSCGRKELKVHEPRESS